MFYDSLVLVSLMISTALAVSLFRPKWFFTVMFPVWALLWLVHLFHWHLAYSHPPAVAMLLCLLFPTMFILRFRQSGWRTIVLSCLGCGVVAYTISILDFRATYHQHQKMLAAYPKVDLKPRLAYESHYAIESTRFDSVLLARQQESFRDFPWRFGYQGGYGVYRNTRRQRAFEALAHVHEGFVADFIAQPAMGWGRIPAMRLLNHYDLETEFEETSNPDQQPPLQDQPPPKLEPSGSPKTAPLDVVQNPPANWETATAPTLGDMPDPESLQTHHFENVLGFAPPNSLGGVNDKLESRGFQSHAYRTPAQSNQETTRTVEAQGWKLARLELVSLLKHKPAAVYVSEHLPAMDELRDAPTRPATTFELDAVAKLREGQELITEPSPHGLRMVGAIRAIEQCRKCHQVPLGGLLGAFSYQFRSGR